MFARGRSFLPFYMRRTGIESPFLFICFILRFHSAFASPTDRWQLLDNAGTVGFPGQNNVMGYECGNDVFGVSDILEALSKYHHHLDQNRHNPLANHAPPVNPNIHQHHYDAIDLQEIEDFDVDQYLNLEEFDTPLESNSPRGYQHSQQHFTPIIYQGPLYSDSGSLNYILWPIQKEKGIPSSFKGVSKLNALDALVLIDSVDHREPYYIVINKQNGEVIDVISRITNNDYTKCFRINGPETESSTAAPYKNSGYQCGHEFISDTLIQKSLHLVVNDEGILNKYPTPYEGRLYPENNGYMIWPIFSSDGLYNYKSVEAGPYFLVVDWRGSLIGIVVEGLSGNFLRCPRSRRFSTTSLTNSPNHFPESVPEPLIPGYFCGRTFFTDKYIKKAAREAKIVSGAKASRTLPAKYKGPPFNKPLLLWPLMENEILYEKGSIGIYSLVLTKKFSVKAVTIKQDKKLRLCEKGMMGEEKDHEKSDYFCFDHLLPNIELVSAAENACSSFLEKRYRFYPAIYRGPAFEKKGPYYTYPVVLGAKFSKRPGRDRVVINIKCEVVGALTTIPGKFAGLRGQRLVQCIKNNVGLGNNFIEPDVAIAEYSRRGRY